MGKLLDLSEKLSVNVYGFVQQMNDSRDKPLASQLLRSATSIGANSREAQGAGSKKDFANKLQIAFKECKETQYWLNLLSKNHRLPQDRISELLSLCNQIHFLLNRILYTTRQNMKSKPPR